MIIAHKYLSGNADGWQRQQSILKHGGGGLNEQEAKHRHTFTKLFCQAIRFLKDHDYHFAKSILSNALAICGGGGAPTPLLALPPTASQHQRLNVMVHCLIRSYKIKSRNNRITGI